MERRIGIATVFGVNQKGVCLELGVAIILTVIIRMEEREREKQRKKEAEK